MTTIVSLQGMTTEGDSTKPGLWTLDCTMDWTLDSIMDSLFRWNFDRQGSEVMPNYSVAKF